MLQFGLLKAVRSALLLSLVLAARMMCQPVAAQDRTVSGTVKDGTGEPLPGVNVFVKNTTFGTITDLEGKYRLSVPPEAGTLVFSSIGLKTMEEEIGSRTVIDLVLEEDITALQEIVVVGYGTQKKINLSGAVDQVEARALESRPIASISQGLQGLVPNLNIDFVSGEPGQAANINIRGFTSINGGEPMILIDGVPANAAELNRLSPADVESISVLKDASSAAIYGARAAFGVILVNTRSGKKEGMRMRYSNFFAWGKPTVLPEKITDPYIFLRTLETSTDNTPWDNQNFSDETYKWARERSDDPTVPGVRINPNDASSWEYMGNRDWTEYFLSDYNFSQMHHVSLEGGGNKSSFYLSGAFDDQQGALKIADDYFKRYNLRSRVDYQALPWLRLGNNTLLSFNRRTKPYHLSMWDLYNFHPVEWDVNPDGTWANTGVGITASKLTQGGQIEDNYTSVFSTLSAEAVLIKDVLRLNTDFSLRHGDGNYNAFQTAYRVGYGPGDVREIGNNAAFRQSYRENYYIFNLYGTFNRDFSGHNITAIAGFSQEFSRTESFSARRDKLISASLPTIALATGDAFVDEEILEWALRGAFYRLNYSYRDRYILEFNGRYDGSSKFPAGNRFGFFPSASAAWRLDQEGFMSGVRPISLLKLRASYGALGNQFVSEYGYIPTMQARIGDYIIGDRLPQEISAPPLVSSNYTWERVSTLNFGLDVGILQNKLVANFDIYSRDTEGMLTLGKDLPDVLGASEPRENAADLRTRGWDFSLLYTDDLRLSGKPLNISARFVLSDNRTEVTRFDNPNGNLTQFYEGMEIGEIWGLQSDGLFKSEEEISQLDQTDIIPWGALSIVPGWPRYKDLDGNGRIEKGLTTSDPKDLSVIGNITARLRYGLDLGLNWNGFDFRVFFQGVGQMDYYPLDYLYWGFYQQPYAGGYTHLLDYYRGQADSEVDRAKHSQAYLAAGLADANPDAKYPVLQAWLADRNLGERVDESMGLAIPQTAYMLNGAYLRLKNLTIGYTLPAALTNRIRLAQVRVFASGENLAEWSELKRYFDPEAITNNAGRIDPSVSPSRDTGKGYAYPFQRRLSLGVNLTF
jgi:TonB-linked SusC/RagA family outer membrane protein